MSARAHFMRIAMALACTIGALPGQTGTAVPGLAVYDQFMNTLLAKYNMPGGALAITQNGRLIFARGYGLADQQQEMAVQPDSLFRIASLSKLVTAVTIMHLVEQGKLDLDQPAFALLPDLQAPPGKTPDPRIASITIRELLEHSGGWNRDTTFDPMFDSPAIVRALGCSAPASTENTIRYMLGEPLQFDPGTAYDYSNFGYAVLGRIIERLTGMSYEEYVRTQVLAPMGISQMRIGQTLPQGQLPKEVKYYSTGWADSVFPDGGSNPVPLPYGGWYLEGQDSHGGWVASVVDYAKFLNALEGRRGPAFLNPASIQAMTARPATIAYWADAPFYYGFALNVEPVVGGFNWWHSGSLDGTTTYEIRTADGFDFVAFFNTRPDYSNTDQTTIDDDIQNGLWSAYYATTDWPTGDLFANYPDSSAALTTPAITTRDGVVNGATYDRGIVSGSWVSLYGVTFSATTETWGSSDFDGNALPASLNGVSVKINGEPAFVEYVSPNQINVQAPDQLPSAWVTAEVMVNGISSGAVLAHTEPNAPGPFTYTAGGLAFAIATEPDGSLIGDPAVESGTVMARPGDVITIWATGLAPSEAGTLAGFPQEIQGVSVIINGAAAGVTYAGLAGPGLFQINVIVPPVPSQADWPVQIAISGATSAATVFLPITTAE